MVSGDQRYDQLMQGIAISCRSRTIGSSSIEQHDIFFSRANKFSVVLVDFVTDLAAANTKSAS